MTNAIKAVKKLTRPNIVFYFAVCVMSVILALSCTGIMGMVGEGEEASDGIYVLEVMKLLSMGAGVALIKNGFSRGAECLAVIPVKREKAAKMLCDKILRFSAVPLCTDIISVLILCYSNHSVEFFNIPSKVLSLGCLSLMSAFAFAWLSLLYAGIKRGNNDTVYIIKLGGCWVIAAALFMIKGYFEYAVITAADWSGGSLWEYGLFALACAAGHFGIVRRKFGEKFRF